MDFVEYQELAHKTAIYPTSGIYGTEYVASPAGGTFDIEQEVVRQDTSWTYPALGLANEVGELLGKLKKLIRDKSGLVLDEDRASLAGEIGDVQWYLAELCEALDMSLDACALANIVKLESRQARGVLGGSGDER